MARRARRQGGGGTDSSETQAARTWGSAFSEPPIVSAVAGGPAIKYLAWAIRRLSMLSMSGTREAGGRLRVPWCKRSAYLCFHTFTAEITRMAASSGHRCAIHNLAEPHYMYGNHMYGNLAIVYTRSQA